MAGDEDTERPEPPSTDAPAEPSDETLARLRSRAEQLRAGRDLHLPPEAEADEFDAVGTPDPSGRHEAGDESDADVSDEDDGGDPFHDVAIDPETHQLLDRWAEEASDESVAPRRNWSPVVAVLVVLAVVGLVGLGAWALIDSSADDEESGVAGSSGQDDASVLQDDAPTLDDLTSDVTLPPGPDVGLTVAEQGITVVPDRFDPARREGTFAVIIQNPHERWLAQGVQVTVTFLDEAGAPLGEDNGFIEVVLPAQKVAVASLFFDAPTVPVGGLDVQVEVARWRETGPVEGGFTITDVQTTEAEFSGVRTTFQIQSDFDEPLTDVGVTAVYRAADGRIIGGYDTFVELLEPGVPTPAEVDLLANIDPASIAATELYPTAAFGSVPD